MYRSRLAFALAMAALATILLPSSLSAQITFVHFLGDTGFNEAVSVQQTADGGYVATGTTGFDPVCIYLMKTDAWGETLWTRSYNGHPGTRGYWVEQTNDGGYAIIAGLEWDGGILLFKTDTVGLISWMRTYGGTGGGGSQCGRQAFDGGFIIAGWTAAYGSMDADVYLVKTDSNGDKLWARTYGGDSSDIGQAVQQTADSGFVIAGWTTSFGAGATDYYLIKTNATGDTQWTRTYGGTRPDECTSVQQTADGGYILGGYTASFGAGDWDVYLVKTDSNGDTMWTRTYGYTDDDLGWCARQTTDGGYVVAGQTYDTCTGLIKAFMVKADSNGVMLWAKTFDSSDSLGSEGHSVLQAEDGGYVLAGYASRWYSLDDVLLVKTAPDGNVAVAEPKASPARTADISLTCEPNPSSGTTTIRTSYIVPRSSLSLYDASGRRVRTLTVNRTSYIVWDGKDEAGQPLASGAYFIRLDAGADHATTRIVLQR